MKHFQQKPTLLRQVEKRAPNVDPSSGNLIADDYVHRIPEAVQLHQLQLPVSTMLTRKFESGSELSTPVTTVIEADPDARHLLQLGRQRKHDESIRHSSKSRLKRLSDDGKQTDVDSNSTLNYELSGKQHRTPLPRPVLESTGMMNRSRRRCSPSKRFSHLTSLSHLREVLKSNHKVS